MPKDNRKIANSVRITDKPLFTEGMEDELAAELDQKRLDELKSEGVLVGDWKSTRGGGISITGDAPSEELAGRISEANLKVTDNQKGDFMPLSAEEAMNRFQEFDFSDEVMRSMQFHKEAIKTKVGAFTGNDSGKKDETNSDNADTGTGEGDPSNANSNDDSTDDEEFPAEFPARSKFIKANKTFAQIKTLSREKLIEIDGIADKTADEIIAYLAK